MSFNLTASSLRVRFQLGATVRQIYEDPAQIEPFISLYRSYDHETSEGTSAQQLLENLLQLNTDFVHGLRVRQQRDGPIKSSGRAACYRNDLLFNS